MRFLHTLFRFRLLSTTLLILGISVSAFAHDPGLSTIVAKVDGQRLEATVTFARKDLENLLAGIPGSDEKKNAHGGTVGKHRPGNYHRPI